ncbi:MAG: hypothetical protein HRT88_11415 [Lentisphaeraceae bacterium]|nr:hypothetical protein [Lentisphaeraceae bacterium]
MKTMLEYGIKGKYKLIQVALGQNLTSFIDDKEKDLQKTNDLSDTFEIAPAFGSTPAYLLTIYSDPTWVQTKLQEVINNGISAAVSYASAKLKEAEDDIDTSITKAGGLILGVINDSGALNSDINLAAIYYYLEGSRDDGDPGWDGVDATITKNETRKGSGSFEVGFSVFGNDFKIKVGGDYTGTLDISTHNIVANITNDPDECKVQITPKYKEEMSFSVTGSLGIVEATLGASFPDETKILTPKITIKLKADASTQQ